MQMDFMDVRLDEKKLPYAVHKAVGVYAGDRGIRIKNPQTAVRVLNEVFHMKDFAEERVYLILMSSSCDVISFAEVGKGVLNHALIGVREILQRALLCNAKRLIVAHNHPELGSTPCPSGSDIDLTGNLMQACRLLQVTFSDHVIIAGDQYFSFREEWDRWRGQKEQEEQAGQEARENPKEQKEPENRKDQRAQEKQKKAAETKRTERTGKAEETGKTKRAEKTGKTEEVEKTGKAE